MNPFLNGYRSPEPPSELRDRVFEAVRKQTLRNHHSLVDRLWMNRKLRISWLTTVIVLFLFLILWNPPVQGSFANIDRPETTEKNELDPLLDRWFLKSGSDGMFAASQKEILQTEDL